MTGDRAYMHINVCRPMCIAKKKWPYQQHGVSLNWVFDNRNTEVCWSILSFCQYGKEMEWQLSNLLIQNLLRFVVRQNNNCFPQPWTPASAIKSSVCVLESEDCVHLLLKSVKTSCFGGKNTNVRNALWNCFVLLWLLFLNALFNIHIFHLRSISKWWCNCF